MEKTVEKTEMIDLIDDTAKLHNVIANLGKNYFLKISQQSFSANRGAAEA